MKTLIIARHGNTFRPGETPTRVGSRTDLPLVEEECCRAAFLRGAFLAGGSVTDPEKGYHLELTTTHHNVAREAYTLIHEVLSFYPKMAPRGGGQVLYLKQSDQISDFLACLGASVASMGIIEAKLEKELKLVYLQLE